MTDIKSSMTFRPCLWQPMTASIWSTPPSLAFSSFPAVTLLRFMHNHHLLQILNRPQWLTLKGGSGNYVKRVLAKVPKDRLHHDAHDGGSGKAVQVKRSGDGGWMVKTADGNEDRYDEVVFATHADTTLALLDETLDSGDSRRDILSRFEFSKNEAVLHGDERVSKRSQPNVSPHRADSLTHTSSSLQLMPVRREAWSAWNFIAEEARSATSATQKANTASTTSSSQDSDRVSLTYWMNLLQSLPATSHGHVLVTLNPPMGKGAAPREELVAGRYTYDHPIYTPQSVAAQKALKPLQGQDGLHFAGAWLNYGFHEDGFTSGLRVGERLGAKLPFDIRSAERDLPPGDVSLVLVEGLEAVRTRLAAPLIRGLHPLIVLASLILEMVANLLTYLLAGPGVRCEIRNGLRRVRVDWERNAAEEVHKGGSGGSSSIWKRITEE